MSDLKPYWHPFHTQSIELEEDLDEGREQPRTVIEMKMIALSNSIREKPEWWVKMNNPEITTKWRAEVHEQQKDVPEKRRLNDEMIDYVFDELKGYAALRDPSTGIQPGPFDRVWKSDELVSAELRNQLLEAIVPLEEMTPDWHPGSNDQVLDLVHPSLYPIVYGRTLTRSGGSEPPEVIDPPEEEDYSISQKFQWLASDFKVSESGQVTLASPYINNVHETRHAKLNEVIPKILQCAVPMFERVLSDLRRRILPLRIEDCLGTAYCIWDGSHTPYPEEENAEYEEDPDAWIEKQPMLLPKAKKYNGDLDAVKKTVSLNGTVLQCIVKLANIVLTPEKPEYPGGSWHVEGMMNEHIVASYIYYYDNENITASSLAFRRATSPPESHEQDDSWCMKFLYNFDRDDPLVQELGKVETCHGRSIAFPNIYQHQVAPFRLEDPTKPGHRKILVFFLVDPTMAVISASDVAPQQREHIQEIIRSAAPNSGLGNLPVELLDMIEKSVDGTMTREEAEDYRLELMKERTVFVAESDSQFFGTEFNMCEH